jgi:hypothetical protein
MSGKALTTALDRSYPIFRVRGQQVVLDSAVAEGFSTDTKRVNEAVRRNPDKFGDAHVFVLSPEEFAALRSQIATSASTRGGSRYPPHVFTAKGVARLATILNTPAALHATDLIIDTFLEVQRQIAVGDGKIAIHEPSRLRPTEREGLANRIREKLTRAVDALLDTVIDVQSNMDVRAVSKELASGALEHVRQRLRQKGLENTKLEAEAVLVMTQAEKLVAEIRKTNAEAEGIEIDNITKRIAAVREVMVLYRETEPSELVQILTDMEQGRPALRDHAAVPGRES